MTDSVAKPVMRAIRADLLAGGALRGFALGAAVAACGLLAARAFFMSLQQAFIDWNNVKSDSPEFASTRDALLAKIADAKAS